jgi:hypothetical protein
MYPHPPLTLATFSLAGEVTMETHAGIAFSGHLSPHSAGNLQYLP